MIQPELKFSNSQLTKNNAGNDDLITEDVPEPIKQRISQENNKKQVNIFCFIKDNL